MFYVPGPPNLVFKPYYDIRNIAFRDSDGDGFTENSISGYYLNPSGDKYIDYCCVIPDNMQAGSDFVVVIDWSPSVSYSSPPEKKWRVIPYYNYARAGAKIGGIQTGDAVLLAVPVDELTYTMHKSEILTVPGLQAGDVFGIHVVRDADHADDDYASKVFLTIPCTGYYIADKVGVVA